MYTQTTPIGFDWIGAQVKLDLFADLRPNMTRYSSIEEVNTALIELEEHEHTASVDKSSNEKHLDTEKPSRSASSNISMNGKSLANGSQQNGSEVHEVMGESDSDSGSGSVDLERQDDDDLEDDNRDDDYESEDDYDGQGPASDEDDEVHVRPKVTEVDPQEEAEFEKELKALMQESLDSRKLELRARPTLNMMIPMHVFESSKGETGDETLEEESGESKEIQVKVLVKRGSKQQTRQMLIPRDCSLVQSTKQKEAAELEEKQDIKRLVLEYNDREEEELNGLAGTQSSTGWAQSGGSAGGRVVGGRGGNPSWGEGGHGRGGGPRHRYPQYHWGGGGGGYYSRRR